MIRAFFLLTFVAVFSNASSAQCAEIDAGDDDLMCTSPATFDLMGTIDGEYIDLFWTPDTGVNDPFSLNTSVTIGTTTEYCLTVQSIDYSINLVENGDFEDGNTGFATDYDYISNPAFPATELVEGQYTVDSEPAGMHVNWEDCDDHSDTGTGQMLIANGDESPGQNLWCQTINVTPNTDYAFSAWVASVDPNGPVEIQFSINGSNIGNGNVGLSTTCLWVNFFEVWNSGANTSITICIEDVNTAEMGNDFLLDDIVFSPICEIEDCLTLTISEFDPQVLNDSPACEGNSITLEAFGGVDYLWTAPNGLTYTGNFLILDNPTIDDEGIYQVQIVDDLGCSIVIDTDVIIFRSDTTEVTEITCDPDLEGTFVQNLFNEFNCDSMVTTIVEYVPPDSMFLSAVSCDSTDIGIEVLYLKNQYSCDSIITIETIYSKADSTYRNSFTCDSTLVVDTILYLTNLNGCDSLIFSSISFIDVDSTFIYRESCDTSQVGANEILLSNEFGCDSIVITITTESPFESIFLQSQTCDPNLVGTFVDTLVNIDGCDSLVITEMNLISPDSTNLFTQTCNPDRVGSFVDTLSNQFGCDSLIFTETTLFPADTTILFTQTCNPDLVGTFLDTLSNQSGCDSLVFTETTLFPMNTTNLFTQTCNPDSVGTFVDTLSNQFGCDSLIFTETTLIPSDTTYLFTQTCNPDFVGTFIDSLSNQFGCDSLIFTETTLLLLDTTFILDYTCDPAMAGITIDTLSNQLGCDSLIFLETTLNNSDSTIINQSTCDPGQAGEFVENLFNENGCDSIVTTVTLLNPRDTSYLFLETCDSSEVSIYEEVLTNTFGCDSIVLTQVDYFSDLEIGLLLNQPDCFTIDEGSVTINAIGGSGIYSYSLNSSPFQEDDIFTNLSSGEYNVMVQDENGCQDVEIFIINAILDVSIELGEDFTIIIGEDTTINSIVNIPLDSISQISWNPFEDQNCTNCLQQNVSPILTTTYGIEVTSTSGCMDSDQLTINVEFDDEIYIPNVFSPNADGRNDVFLIFSKANVIRNIKLFQGYDRWGNKIWDLSDVQPNDLQYSWDGYYKDKAVNPGVFVWIAEIEFMNNTTKRFSGDVTVVK